MNAPTTDPRVVIVHDWLTGFRGGERVVDALVRLFPTAEVRTMLWRRGTTTTAIDARVKGTSILQWLPAAARLYRHALPLYPMAIETVDVDEADLVISTSHAAAKAVVRPGRARHICYCHSPMRYAWDQFEAYFGPDKVGRAGSALLRPTLAWLARWDRRTAGRVDEFVANSAFVAARIGRYYNRRASVVHPPVDTRFFTPASSTPEPYFLVVSALVPYKRVDVAIDAAAKLEVPVKVVGTGPERAALEQRAGSSVEFLGSVTSDTLLDLYRRATALVMPAEEDFGIAPVEAMACGCPVVALGRGGAAETVVHGETGWLVAAQTVPAFAAAMNHARASRLDRERLARHAAAFGEARFDAEFRSVVARVMDGPVPC